MNESPRAAVSVFAALFAWITLEKASLVFAILASLIAILAGLPVVIDRWRHLLPACITRYFPAKPAAQ